MKKTHFRFLILSIASLVYSIGFAYNPSQYSSGKFKGCAPTGKGGDSYLNSLKNRDISPSKYDDVTIDDVLNSYPSNLPCGPGASHYRSNWSSADQHMVEQYESKGVRIEGYILAMKQQGAEACNCKGAAGVDHHLWLAKAKNSQKADAMVIEISPRLLSTNTNWKSKTMTKFIKNKAKFRVSGWLTWDEEHPNEVGHSRATLWEIHPVMLLEVFSGGKWVKL